MCLWQRYFSLLQAGSSPSADGGFTCRSLPSGFVRGGRALSGGSGKVLNFRPVLLGIGTRPGPLHRADEPRDGPSYNFNQVLLDYGGHTKMGSEAYKV